MQISKLPGPFGAEVTDLELTKDMRDETMRALIQALFDNQILLIRQQDLTEADYVKFGYFWGTPLSFFIESHKRVDFPEMIRIQNKASTPARHRDGAMHWHSDSSYEELPATVTMLYGVEAPAIGGETLLASTTLAYEALPEAKKQMLDGLIGLHCLGGSPELPGEKIPFIPESTALHGIQKHPLVMPHPVTGRKALFPSGTTFSFEGAEREEGRALITELRAHCVQPQFVNAVKVGKGDILLWDNYQTMHTATAIEYSDEDGKRRLLYRISTKGIPDLFKQNADA